jgi:hypothetical protein
MLTRDVRRISELERQLHQEHVARLKAEQTAASLRDLLGAVAEPLAGDPHIQCLRLSGSATARRRPASM